MSDITNHIASPDARISKCGRCDYVSQLKPRVMSLVIFTALVGMVTRARSRASWIGFTALLCIAVGAGLPRAEHVV